MSNDHDAPDRPDRPDRPARPEGPLRPCKPSASQYAAGRQTGGRGGQRAGRPRVRPAADLVEREEAFFLYLDMPGVAREDLVVDIEGDEMIITAVTRMSSGANERVHALEFGDVEYHAAFALSDMVDAERITAQLANGVLVVEMPRREAARPRRIRVEVG